MYLNCFPLRKGCDSSFWTNLLYCIDGWVVPSVVKIDPMTLEQIIECGHTIDTEPRFIDLLPREWAIPYFLIFIFHFSHRIFRYQPFCTGERWDSEKKECLRKYFLVIRKLISRIWFNFSKLKWEKITKLCAREVITDHIAISTALISRTKLSYFHLMLDNKRYN